MYIKLNEAIRVHRIFLSNSCYPKIAYKTNLAKPNLTYPTLTQPRLT